MPWLILVLGLLCIQNAALQSASKEEVVDFRRCLPKGRVCERVQCAPILGCDEASSSTIVEEGSWCKCCPICQTVLKHGDPCPIPSPYKEPLAICPHNARCCEKNNLCWDPIEAKLANMEVEGCKEKLKIPRCLEIYQRRKEVSAQGYQPIYDFKPFEIREDLWLPDCDMDGNFLPKQCKHRKCLCVDSDTGESIFGQEEIELAVNMTCACSLALSRRKKADENAWQTYVQEHCTKSGDYEELQCVEDTCFCADPATGSPQGSMVKMQQRDLLPCFDPKLHKESYMSHCEKQTLTQRRLLFDFSLKGISIKGLHGIRCDMDGQFYFRHCSPDTCYCTDRSGISFGVYKMDKNSGELEATMNCRCARDEEDVTRNHARYEKLKCDQKGNFAAFQCFDGQCFCVDEDGDRISEILLPEVDRKPDMNRLCLDARFELLLASQRPPVSTVSTEPTSSTYYITT